MNKSGKKHCGLRSIECCAGKNIDPRSQNETKANNTAAHDRQEAPGRGHCVAQTRSWRLLASSSSKTALVYLRNIFLWPRAKRDLLGNSTRFQELPLCVFCIVAGKAAQWLTRGNVPTRALTVSEGREQQTAYVWGC